jgi:hypothetical protein
MGTTTMDGSGIMSPWRGLPRFRNYKNVKMAALPVTRGAQLTSDLTTDFPLEAELKIQAQRASMRRICCICSSSGAIGEPIFPSKQFGDGQN